MGSIHEKINYRSVVNGSSPSYRFRLIAARNRIRRALGREPTGEEILVEMHPEKYQQPHIERTFDAVFGVAKPYPSPWEARQAEETVHEFDKDGR